MRFRFLEHTADVKFQAYGKSLEEAFENSALAMFSSMYDGKVSSKLKKKIKVKGKDYESLLYNFLEELLFLLDSKNFFVSKVKVQKIKNLNLTANLAGDDVKNYKTNLDVKAITYNSMFVRQISCWKFVCQVVLDV